MRNSKLTYQKIDIDLTENHNAIAYAFIKIAEKTAKENQSKNDVIYAISYLGIVTGRELQLLYVDDKIRTAPVGTVVLSEDINLAISDLIDFMCSIGFRLDLNDISIQDTNTQDVNYDDFDAILKTLKMDCGWVTEAFNFFKHKDVERPYISALAIVQFAKLNQDKISFKHVLNLAHAALIYGSKTI